MPILPKRLDQPLLELKDSLPPVFFRKDLLEKASVIAQKYEIDDEDDILKLRKQATKLNLKWNTRAQYDLLTFLGAKNLLLDDVFFQWISKKNIYGSHFTALFFLGFTDQRPKSYFFTSERSKPNFLKQPLNEIAIKQSFLKPHRFTENFFVFQKTKFYLLEKHETHNAGIVQIPYNYSGTEYKIPMTGPERTLIDSVISPHYSGGIANVVYCFSDVQIYIEHLYEIYQMVAPKYPYWQSLGLILEKIKGKAIADEWRSLFKNTSMIEFFIDKEYKPFWGYSKEWKVHYPKGIFND